MARTTVSLPDGLHERAQAADVTVSSVLRDALEDRLKAPNHHFLNTNEDNLPDGQTGAGVYGHGVAATFADADAPDDIDEYGGHIGAIDAGDRIYSFQNEVGLRGFGIALEDGNAEPVPPEHRLFHPQDADTHEFHVPVYWVAVLSPESAVKPDEIKRITGHPVWGRGTKPELNPEKHHPNLLRDVILGRAD
jgi:hypothetical protein